MFGKKEPEVQPELTQTQKVEKKTLPKRHENNELLDEIGKKREGVKRRAFWAHLAWSGARKKKFDFFKQGLGGLIDEYRNYESLKAKAVDKYLAYETVVSGATDTFEYYVLIVLSCVIATMGLYQNSPAVIIGAMIVAPLMGPIFGLSAGVLWGDTKVIWEAVTALFKGIIIAVGITSLMSWLIPGITVTEEMLGRGAPTLFDSIVALSCGFIGAYAFVNKKVSSTISGVAISVALMPPVCTIGIGIGLGEWALAKGATLLFLINLLGISLSALITFYLVRLNPHTEESEEELQRVRVRAFGQIAVTLILLLAISVPLVFLMGKSYQKTLEEKAVTGVITQQFDSAEIYAIEYAQGSPNRVELIFYRVPQELSNFDGLQAELSNELGAEVSLAVFSFNSLK